MRNKSVNTIMSDDIMDNKPHGYSQHKSSPQALWDEAHKISELSNERCFIF